MSTCFFLIDEPRKPVVKELVRKYSKSDTFKLVYLVPTAEKLEKKQLFDLVARATVEACQSSGEEELELWRENGQMKVALKTADLQQVGELIGHAKQLGLNCGVVEGRIAFVGVEEVSKVDQVCGELKLL